MRQESVIVDPKGNDFSKYTYASILTPNIHEFEQIVGPVNDDQVLIQKSLELIQKLSLEALLVTRGANGMTLVLKNGNTYFMLHFPHIPINSQKQITPNTHKIPNNTHKIPTNSPVLKVFLKDQGAPTLSHMEQVGPKIEKSHIFRFF